MSLLDDAIKESYSTLNIAPYLAPPLGALGPVVGSVVGLIKVAEVLSLTKWEGMSRAELDQEQTAVKAWKNKIPGLTVALRPILKTRLYGIAKDDLAKRLFDNYLETKKDLHKQEYKLTLDEMKTMNSGTLSPRIDIRKKDTVNVNPAFAAACGKTQESSAAQDYSGKLGWAYENGAIANYTVNYSGEVTAGNGEFSWEGTVNFYDEFNMDPRWGWSEEKPQGRSRLGEHQTRIGYILSLGTEFKITSETAKVYQVAGISGKASNIEFVKTSDQK
jgi:hypothetical protein